MALTIKPFRLDVSFYLIDSMNNRIDQSFFSLLNILSLFLFQLFQSQLLSCIEYSSNFAKLCFESQLQFTAELLAK